MKIGIYGGSFNPIHKGHIKIAQYTIDKLNLDKLYFVPSYKPPFKSKIKYIDAKHRVKMIELVKISKSNISMFEINKKGTSFTIDTIRYFKSKFINDELFLIIGSDNLYKLNKWKEINEIVKKTQIIVLKRQGKFSKINIKKYNAILLNNPLFDYASSWFRKGYTSNIDNNVMKYIAKNYLYINDLIKNMLDYKKYKHSVSVGSYAAKYAKLVGIDPQKAWATGSLHDITKTWTNEMHLKYLQKNGIDTIEIPKHQFHSITSMLWVKNEYKLDDHEVHSAILKHTSLSLELSKLDKIIFVADKLCDGRAYENIQKDRILISKNFEKGFKKIINVIYNRLLEQNKNLTKKQIKIYEKWK